MESPRHRRCRRTSHGARRQRVTGKFRKVENQIINNLDLCGREVLPDLKESGYLMGICS